MDNTLFHKRYGGKMIDDYQHELVIFAIALSLDAKNILETGVREGTVTEALIKAVNMTGGKLTSVDIEDRSGFKFENWNFVQSDSIKFLTESNEIYDLIYIDDWHEYNHVKKQLELLERLVTNKSVILLHDAMYGCYQPNYRMEMNARGEFGSGGVARAVLELDKTVWEWCTLPCNHGLTILRKIY